MADIENSLAEKQEKIDTLRSKRADLAQQIDDMRQKQRALTEKINTLEGPAYQASTLAAHANMREAAGGGGVVNVGVGK